MKHFLTLSKISVFLSVALVLGACSSDNNTEETKTVTFSFEVQADDQPLVFDDKKYLTPLNQLISFERINIYVSNVQLKGSSSGDLFIETDSYHLISFDAENGTANFEITNVPATLKVHEIILSIGVDTDANTSIDHVGDLDPTNGMAWDWNTGYKFLSLEGRYFDGDEPLGEEIKMHIGTDKNYYSRIFNVGEPVNLKEKDTFHFLVDGKAPFEHIDLSEGTVFMNDERGDEVAQNYRDGLIILQ
ncbi:hypothetical protein SAMN04488029_3084 [Reichenbachiella faecimaris]|uniref:Copper-binding protein MbnP-like domain-containing protein n=2 Tax=Reichenbachiella faecimaris TaxID=692418 RepID=A0A1W2GJJ1_REIFA|nr:hypothetical protein SAMN04488029_3084 [Reichenbachiella faecimaris]